MNDSDRPIFARCLLGAGELYGKPVSKQAAELWWHVLKGYDIAAVESAFAIHMADPDSGQFMPKPADIVRRMSGTTQDSALRAWAEVDNAVRRIGPYQSVAFGDATTMRVLQDMGGWLELCQKDDNDWPFVAKEFENRYRGYRQRGEEPKAPDHLAGLSEADAVRLGRPAKPPVRIGHVERAPMLEHAA